MTDPQIATLKRQIAELTDELYRLEKRSKSIWNTVYQAFLDEGNDEDIAGLWADRIADIMSSWANGKRTQLANILVKTGEMPPYSQCLNDLIADVSPPGSQPSPIEIGGFSDVGSQGSALPPPPPPTGAPLEASTTPKMQRVYVPKPFPEMELS